MSALYFRRTTPHSVYGTTYVTLMPRYWETTTFLWDISLSAMLLSMLDPCVLRKMMEVWMTVDMHKHFGTEFLTGAGVGPWYSVNDYAMCRMAKEYLRWTGDRTWLDKTVGAEKGDGPSDRLRRTLACPRCERPRPRRLRRRDQPARSSLKLRSRGRGLECRECSQSPLCRRARRIQR